MGEPKYLVIINIQKNKYGILRYIILVMEERQRISYM